MALIVASRRKDFEKTMLKLDTDYVLVFMDKQIISLNMIEIIENSHHEIPYKKQTVRHGQRSLRGEIIERYVNHARTNKPTTLETIDFMGLIVESDAWYNKHKQKSNKLKKELVK